MTSGRIASGCALLAAVCAFANLATMAVAVDLEVGRLFAFGSLVDADDAGERWLVASLWVDAAFYVALIPVAWGLAGPRRGTVGAVAGTIYALAGAAGAIALALAWPGHFAAFDRGEPGASEAFRAVTDLVVRGVWNGACAAAGAAWWGAVAAGRRDHRTLTGASAALAVGSVAEGIASACGATAAADAILGPLLALLPVWCLVAARALARP